MLTTTPSLTISDVGVEPSGYIPFGPEPDLEESASSDDDIASAEIVDVEVDLYEKALNIAIAEEGVHHHPNPDIVPFSTKAYKGDLASPGSYPHFKSLISKIHSHLRQSSYTRSSFLRVFNAVFEGLRSEGKAEQHHHIVSDAEFIQELEKGFPTYNLFWTSQQSLWEKQVEDYMWGLTSPSRVPDTIYLLGDLVEWAENAVSNPSLSKVSAHKIQVLIVSTILREMCHHFVATFFGATVDTPGLGNGQERGFGLESTLMQGNVGVHWDNGGDFPYLTLVDQIIFEPRGSWQCSQEIREIDAAKFIASLSEEELSLPVDNAGFWL